MKRVRSFFINTVILTLSALVMRTVSVSYNVYLSDKLGAGGIGLLQLIMTVYSFGVTFASSGIRLASTRLVVESISKNNSNVKGIMIRCIIYSLTFGLFAGIILYFNSGLIAEKFINNIGVASSFKILSIALPFLAVSSALGGYFTAVRKVARMSAVSFTEQAINIGVTLFLLIKYLPYGIEKACNAVVIGSCTAEVISFLITLVLFRIDIRKTKSTAGDGKGLTKKLISIAIPDAVSSYVRSALITTEHILIPYGLRKRGASSEKSLSDYGVVSAMALPIITFPTVLTYSVSGLLIPEIGESFSKKNYRHINYITSRTLRIVLLFSIGTAGMMFAFGDDLGYAIYDNIQAAGFIRLLAPVIPVMYLDTAVDGVLKGMGEQISSMRYNIIDALLSVILVFFLVPKMGVYGYIVTIFASEILNFYLSFNKLGKIADFKIYLLNDIIKPVFCISGAVSVPKLIIYWMNINFTSVGLLCVVLVVVSLVIYLLSLYIMGAVGPDDIKWIKGIISIKKDRNNV